MKLFKTCIYVGWLCGALSASVSWASTDLVRFGGGEVITVDDLSAYVARRIDLKSAVKSEWGLKMALTEMAETRALVLDGVKLGEPRNSDERFDDAYALSIYQKQAPMCERPNDEQAAKRYYEAHPEAFRLPVQMRLSRIMVPTGAPIDKISPEAWIQLQAQAIAAAATTFDAVAERARELHALDPQGDLGWVLMSEDVPLLKAIASTKEGDMIGPVREGEYWYLFSVLGRREARQLTWDEVGKQVPARAVQFCVTQARAQKREDLFRRYGVTFDNQAIRALSLGGGADVMRKK